METDETKKDRRTLLKLTWTVLGIAAIIEFAVMVVLYLKPRKKRGREEAFGDVITTGHMDDFKKGSVTAFRRGQFYLVRFDDGGFMALSRKCTHLGCSVPWVEPEKRFISPCHSSVFNIKGEVLQAPAPRPLDMFSVFIENNIVKVDTKKRIKRDGFSKNQVVYS